MVVLVLRLALVLGSLELVHGLLELSEGILVVLFGLLFLLLEEFKFTLPKGLLLFKLALKVGMLSLHFVVLGLPVLYLLPDAKLSLGQGLVELLILLLEFEVLHLIALNKLFLLSL